MASRQEWRLRTDPLTPVNCCGSAHAKAALAWSRTEVRQNGLACDRRLPFGDQRAGTFRQVDVETRAETDHPEPLAGSHRLALARRAHDPPGDQTGDLHHRDASARTG